MNAKTYEPILRSLEAFLLDSEMWPKEINDDVSLSKFSIHLLLSKITDLPRKDLMLNLSPMLRVVALKREYDGASIFIAWSLANSYKFDDPDTPINNKYFTDWLNTKKSGKNIIVPDYDELTLADFADEFLHLHSELGSLQQAAISDGDLPIFSVLVDSLIYFDKTEDMVALAERVLNELASAAREDPAYILAESLEQFGFSTVNKEIGSGITKSLKGGRVSGGRVSGGRVRGGKVTKN